MLKGNNAVVLFQMFHSNDTCDENSTMYCLFFCRRKANEHFRNHDPHEKGDVQETEHTKRLLDTLLTKTCIFQNNVSSHNHRLQFWTSNTPKNMTNKPVCFFVFMGGTFPIQPFVFFGCFFGASILLGGMAEPTMALTKVSLFFSFFW